MITFIKLLSFDWKFEQFKFGNRVIDNKSLRLITASSTSTPVSRDKSDLDAASRGMLFFSYLLSSLPLLF